MNKKFCEDQSKPVEYGSVKRIDNPGVDIDKIPKDEIEERDCYAFNLHEVLFKPGKKGRITYIKPTFTEMVKIGMKIREHTIQEVPPRTFDEPSHLLKYLSLNGKDIDLGFHKLDKSDKLIEIEYEFGNPSDIYKANPPYFFKFQNKLYIELINTHNRKPITFYDYERVMMAEPRYRMTFRIKKSSDDKKDEVNKSNSGDLNG
ncbi:MAG: hypothetical protein ACTSXD_06865 [Candidatus Heimdallarchaeaceae archaeon]